MWPDRGKVSKVKLLERGLKEDLLARNLKEDWLHDLKESRMLNFEVEKMVLFGFLF